MSEFECSNGHLMIPSKSIGGRCHICGAPCVRMDGYTNRQLRAMEEEDRGIEEEEEEELMPWDDFREDEENITEEVDE